jgi:hypothetical protein
MSRYYAGKTQEQHFVNFIHYKKASTIKADEAMNSSCMM